MCDSRVSIDKSDINKEIALIDYPGQVRNVENMIKTLSGLPNISQVFCGEKRRLELRFHPKNAFNKPACGDLHQTAGLLLKIKVRKNKKKSEGPQHHVEVLGRCRKVVKFDSLCDFQYLPVVKTKESGTVECVYDKIFPKSITDQDWWLETDRPLFCAPGTFARVDTIPSGMYRKNQPALSNPDLLGIKKSKQIESVQFQHFNLVDSFPTKPLPDVVKRMTIKYVSDSQLEKVKKLFEECPIWNRVALIYEAGITNEKIKSILPAVAYYFASGPWRTFYVRLGYDPRKDFQSRYYQLIDFRLRCRPGVTEHIKIKSKAKKDALRAESNQAGTSSQGVVQDITYPYFEEGRLPRYRQCIYRYCDLKLPQIVEMLEKIPSPLSGATCNEKTGWLPPGFDDQVRQILTESIKEQIKSVGQQSANEEDDDIEEDEFSEEEMDDLEEEFEQLLEGTEYEEN